MRSAELLVYGIEGKAADRLQSFAQDQGLWFRPITGLKPLLSLLRKGSRGTLVVRVGRDLREELDMVRRAADGFPELKIVVLSDADQPHLEGLAYDLGATCAVFPPQGNEELIAFLRQS